MKDNRYTRAIDSVEISEDVLENALRCAKDNRGKVINMKKRSKGFLKITAAAACMALLIGVGGAVMNKNDDNTLQMSRLMSHEFTITANAAELRRDVSLNMGELQSGAGGIEFIEEDKALSIEQGLPFTLRIEGDGIESVTFSVDESKSDDMSMKFMLRKDFASLTQNNGIDDKISEYSSIPGCTGAAEFTVAYENQLTEKQFQPYAQITDDESAAHMWSHPLELWILLDHQPAEDFYSQHPDFKHEYPDRLNNAISNCFVKFVNDHSDFAKIKVTVNFTDGVSQTENVYLTADTKENSEGWVYGVLYASLGEESTETFDIA